MTGVMLRITLNTAEVRVLAHYLYPYDNGAYAKAVLSKDMHWYHSKLAGFWTLDDRDWPSDAEAHLRTPEMKEARTKSKGFFFGYLYGQGSSIRGSILSKDQEFKLTNTDTGIIIHPIDETKIFIDLVFTQKEYEKARERVESRLVEINGKMFFPLRKEEYVKYSERLIYETIYGEQIANTFLTKMAGIKDLLAECGDQSKNKKSVTAIDGRELYSRSPHSALNLLLQGSAGVIAKQWMVNFNALAKSKGLVLGRDYWQSAYIHDEYQCACKTEFVPILEECLEHGAAQVTEQFCMNLPIKADAGHGSNWSDTH